MKFQAAYSYLKRGHDIALPEWGGFWRWSEKAKTIHMHTRHGTIIDIRRSEDMDYTLSFLFRDDWELVDPATRTEHAVKAEQNREDTPSSASLGSTKWERKIIEPEGPKPWYAGPTCPKCHTQHFPGLPCPSFLATT